MLAIPVNACEFYLMIDDVAIYLRSLWLYKLAVTIAMHDLKV